MSNKDYALQYLRKGLSIIPLKSPAMVWKTLSPEDLIKQCKVPIIKWKEYRSKLATEAEVRKWFTNRPDANIGIFTGKISGIVVFDLDSELAVQYAEDYRRIDVSIAERREIKKTKKEDKSNEKSK